MGFRVLPAQGADKSTYSNGTRNKAAWLSVSKAVTVSRTTAAVMEATYQLVVSQW